MKKIISILILLCGLISAQTITPAIAAPSFQTPDGYNAVYTITMSDSTGTTYSPNFNVAGYIPQDLTSNPVSFYLIATGTKDSIKVILQSRMKKAEGVWSTWKATDTVSVIFNKVDGYAYNYSLDLNSNHPDQIRFQVIGASAVNRADVVCTVIGVFKKQYGIFSVR